MKKLALIVAAGCLALSAPVFACPHDEAAPKTAEKKKDDKGQTDKAKEQPKKEAEKAPETAKAPKKDEPKKDDTTKKPEKVSQK